MVLRLFPPRLMMIDELTRMTQLQHSKVRRRFGNTVSRISPSFTQMDRRINKSALYTHHWLTATTCRGNSILFLTSLSRFRTGVCSSNGDGSECRSQKQIKHDARYFSANDYLRPRISKLWCSSRRAKMVIQVTRPYD